MDAIERQHTIMGMTSGERSTHTQGFAQGAELSELPPASWASLVEAIHAAGVNAGEWPQVLEQLRHSLDASVVTLCRHEFTTGADATLYQSPADSDFGRAIAAYAARNPWFMSSDDYVAGRVLTSDDLVSVSDLRRTDFYRGFLRPRGLLHRLCAVVAQREQAAVLLSAYRTEQDAGFGTRERADLQGLLGHIALSLENQWRWQEADGLWHALLALIDQDGLSVILVAADGELVYRNAAATHLLEKGAGLRCTGNRIEAASAADRRQLREAIAATTQLARSESGAPGEAAPRVVTLACSQPGLPVVVVIRPAGLVYSRASGRPRSLALLTLRTPASTHDPAICALARMYELTAAQAKVGTLVCAGQSLVAIARQLKVSENTVRSHLSQVFQKTGTHSKMDLVHLHARVCTSLT